MTSALIRSKEEELVLLDWTSDCSAKLILLQYRPGLVIALEKEIVSVQCVISKKLEKISMKMICAGLCHHIHICAGASTETGVIETGLNFKLQDCVRIGYGDARVSEPITGLVSAEIVDVRAIHRISVVDGTAAVYKQIGSVSAELAGVGDVSLNTGIQIKNLRIVSVY